MNQTMDSMLGKAIYAFLGFGIPLIILATHVLLGWGGLPIIILAFSWFGFATFFYIGLSDEEIAG